MNPALIAAMNFALSRNNGKNEEEDKEEIKKLMSNIDNWYKGRSKEEKKEISSNGYISDNKIEDDIYNLNQKYKVKFNTKNGKFQFPQKENNMSTKLTDLLKESLEEAQTKAIDEVGKFFIVYKPTKDSKKEDIMKEYTVFDDFDKSNVIGAFKQKSDASREATQAIKNFTSELNELENEMEEFRKHKAELNTKKQSAVKRIKKMKGE